MSPATSLPSEIWGETFEYHHRSRDDLSNFCLVHKTWYPIAQRILYRSARFQDHDAIRFLEAINEYPHIYPMIQALELQSLSTAALEAFEALGPSSNVSSLRLLRHRIDADQQSILSRSFPQLQKLSLKHSIFYDGLSGLVRLLSSFSRLSSLALTEVSYLPNRNETTYPDIGIPASLRVFDCHLGPLEMDSILRWMLSHSPMPPIESVFIASYGTYEDLPVVVSSFLSSLPTLKIAWVGINTMWDPPSLTFAENPQLETIRLDFDLRGLNPLRWIPFLSMVFSSVSSVVVETIVITMRMTGGCAPNFDWQDLGRVLRSPIFSNLRMVHIACTDPYTLQESPYVGDLEGKICEALAHLVAKNILTVSVPV